MTWEIRKFYFVLVYWQISYLSLRTLELHCLLPSDTNLAGMDGSYTPSLDLRRPILYQLIGDWNAWNGEGVGHVE